MRGAGFRGGGRAGGAAARKEGPGASPIRRARQVQSPARGRAAWRRPLRKRVREGGWEGGARVAGAHAHHSPPAAEVAERRPGGGKEDAEGRSVCASAAFPARQARPRQAGRRPVPSRPRRPWAPRLTLPGGDGAGRAEAGQGGGHQDPTARLRRRRLLEAAAGHLLALRAGGAGPADARRGPQGRREHARPGQGLPGGTSQADHRQGSAEERLGGY